MFGSKTTLIALFLVLLSASSGFARDDMANFSIKEALDIDAKGKLEPEIRLSFGHQAHRSAMRIGRWDSSKSSSLSDGPKAACQRSFLAAVVSLQRRAKKEGGNAVINIISYHGRRETSSSNTYVCSLGGHRAAVVLMGTVVRTGR